MNKHVRWALLLLLVLGSVFLAIRQRYVLDSAELNGAIDTELRVGSSKAAVVNFVRARHPVFLDDNGNQVKARISGLAENMIYRKDVMLSFEFDSEGKLLAHSAKVYFTFL
jgi:hypothetical protein